MTQLKKLEEIKREVKAGDLRGWDGVGGVLPGATKVGRDTHRPTRTRRGSSHSLMPRWAETRTHSDTDTHVERYSLVPRGGQRQTYTHTQIHTRSVHGEGGTPWCHEVGKRVSTHTCPAVDPACSPTGSSRRRRNYRKILDRAPNSISEAKTREKHKKEA